MTAEDDAMFRDRPLLPVEERPTREQWWMTGPIARMLHAPLNDLLDGCRDQRAAYRTEGWALFEATTMIGETGGAYYGRVSVATPHWREPDAVTVYVYAWTLASREPLDLPWLLLHRRGPVDATTPSGAAEDVAWALSHRVGGSEVLAEGHLPRFSLRLAASRAEQLAMATEPEHPQE